MNTPSPTNEFDAAKQITDILKNVDKAKHQQVLKWVSESVGAALPMATPQGTLNPNAAAAGGGLIPPSPPAGTPTSDIRSFVKEKNPKSDIHFAAAVAYYYRFLAPRDDRRDSVNGEILQDSARKSGREVFTQPVTPLGNAVKQGYLDRVGRGDFRLNAVGENLVAMTLPGTNNDAGGRSSQKKSKTRTRKRTTKKT
jgi:hypothetical protein